MFWLACLKHTKAFGWLAFGDGGVAVLFFCTQMSSLDFRHIQFQGT